jgi:26S proteasome regulatory subunit N1
LLPSSRVSLADVRSSHSIGIAYAGTHREDIRELLLPAIADTSVSLEIASISALALGFVFVGSSDGEVTEAVLQTMMEREEKELSEKWGRFLALGLALLYLGSSPSLHSSALLPADSSFFHSTGRTEANDATLETLKVVEAPLGKVASVLVRMCSYAGTGSVLNIQAMLHEVTDHLDPEKESDLHQAVAVIGIALIAMGEDVGSQMSLRQFNHLVRLPPSLSLYFASLESKLTFPCLL